MSIDQPPSDKMMHGAPGMKQFHFSGDGIWHNMTIVAQDIEQATRQWLSQRRLISPFEQQSTPVPEPAPESEVQ